MQQLHWSELKTGLSFIFVGDESHIKEILNNCNDLEQSYHTNDLRVRNFTDKHLQEIGIVIVHKTNEVQILDIINFPAPEIDWNKTLTQFIENYNNQEPSDSKFKWGQIAPRDCEIMCDNCGYITALKKGETFPFCEACQSGMPGSPTDSHEEFWIML